MKRKQRIRVETGWTHNLLVERVVFVVLLDVEEEVLECLHGDVELLEQTHLLEDVHCPTNKQSHNRIQHKRRSSTGKHVRAMASTEKTKSIKSHGHYRKQNQTTQ